MAAGKPCIYCNQFMDRLDDNGCHVQARVWVDFSGTPYDREKKDAEAAKD